MLEKDLFPTLGNRPIGNITALELLCTLRKIESRGAIETTRRTKQVAGKSSAMQLQRDEQNEILPGI